MNIYANRVAIVGVTGYAGQELERLLASHPKIQIAGKFASKANEKSGAEAFSFERLRGFSADAPTVIPGLVWIRTYRPGSPGRSGVWVAGISSGSNRECPDRGESRLVCNGRRVAAYTAIQSRCDRPGVHGRRGRKIRSLWSGKAAEA